MDESRRTGGISFGTMGRPRGRVCAAGWYTGERERRLTTLYPFSLGLVADFFLDFLAGVAKFRPIGAGAILSLEPAGRMNR